ncbi:hypothetical protein EVAR_53679_1 [Eumeta japonica]|uniref:Uncharacterized protein n=1 Tax=Eumeta variegata TaxID=151549 RepID=A0A4C1YQ66_EUMVA|nr:hypothetical protein EVAR_53679_1 [Eumeta japonica]
MSDVSNENPASRFAKVAQTVASVTPDAKPAASPRPDVVTGECWRRRQATVFNNDFVVNVSHVVVTAFIHFAEEAHDHAPLPKLTPGRSGSRSAGDDPDRRLYGQLLGHFVPRRSTMYTV